MTEENVNNQAVEDQTAVAESAVSDENVDWEKRYNEEVKQSKSYRTRAQNAEQNVKKLQKSTEASNRKKLEEEGKLQEIINNSKKLNDQELINEVVKATNGEVIEDENHVENKIKEAVEGLGKRDAYKVMKALRDKKIHLGNLDISLDRIKEMKQA